MTYDGCSAVVQYFTIPWTNVLIGGGFRLGRPAMLAALRASLDRLGVEQLDLWQVMLYLSCRVRLGECLGLHPIG